MLSSVRVDWVTVSLHSNRAVTAAVIVSQSAATDFFYWLH